MTEDQKGAVIPEGWDPCGKEGCGPLCIALLNMLRPLTSLSGRGKLLDPDGTVVADEFKTLAEIRLTEVMKQGKNCEYFQAVVKANPQLFNP